MNMNGNTELKTLAPMVAKAVSSNSTVVANALVEGTKKAKYEVERIKENVMGVASSIVDEYVDLLVKLDNGSIQQIENILSDSTLSDADKTELIKNINEYNLKKQENVNVPIVVITNCIENIAKDAIRTIAGTIIIVGFEGVLKTACKQHGMNKRTGTRCNTIRSMMTFKH